MNAPRPLTAEEQAAALRARYGSTYPGPAQPVDEESALRSRYREQLDPANVPYLDSPEQSQARAAAGLAIGRASGRADVDTKRLATAQAKLALAGFQLERMADGSFVVAKWTMTRSLADMAAVDAFMRQVGAA